MPAGRVSAFLPPFLEWQNGKPWALWAGRGGVLGEENGADSLASRQRKEEPVFARALSICPDAS